MNKALLEELKRLSAADRIELVHDLWDSIPPGESSSWRADLLALPSAERIELAMDLWDSIAPEDMPLPSPEQMAEIERRWAEHQRDPSSAIPWEEVQARLRSRFG